MLTRAEIGMPLLRTIVGKLLPIISTIMVRPLPIIGNSRNNAARSSSSRLPTIADDRQDGNDCRQAGSINRLNNRYHEAGTWLVTEQFGGPTVKVDGPTAALQFVRWAAEHGCTREWKVDEIWFIASEDFAPANNIQLPPRRVFLGALKRMPGVTCTPNRRVYDRNGDLQGKTTFYRLPTTSEVRTAAEAPALRAVKRAA